MIVWAYILGPIGAILAIPASLLFKALLVDMDSDAQWLGLFLGDRPVFKERTGKRTPLPVDAGDTEPDEVGRPPAAPIEPQYSRSRCRRGTGP